MKKSSSFNVLLSEGALQSRWRQNAGASFIRIRKNKFKSQFFYLLLLLLVALVVYITMPTNHAISTYHHFKTPHLSEIDAYDSKYPLTKPINNVHQKTTTYKIGIIADLDTNSKRNPKNTEFSSFIKKGFLTVSMQNMKFDFAWDDGEKEIENGYGLKGRGMELSELVTFNGKLLTFDDRTGIVFIVSNDTVIPWVILTDGESMSSKGFKSEWATVKNHQLYVGSMGKEWTNAGGKFENNNPMMVKVVSTKGEVKTLNWVNNYKAIRRAINIEWPGYLIHESGAWSDFNQKWYFLPRRCSETRYNETLDESKGCNYLIIADDTFTDIHTVKIGELKPTRGYSSFKFIPDTNDSIIVALKTEELNGSTSTYVTIFDVRGNILLPDEKIQTEFKYEGFEFI